MKTLLVIVIVLLCIDIAVNAGPHWLKANAENAYYSCIECHNKSTYRKTWTRLGSEKLHTSHEAKGTDCTFCHYYNAFDNNLLGGK